MTREQIIELIHYIRRVEEKIDSEWGMCRDWRQLEADGEMPKEYYYLIDVVGQVD